MSGVVKRRKPTIRDVAEVAGVSRGTVSRVLNGGHWVSPDARELVEKAIQETGYTANHHARSLATGRSNSLAFLLTEPHHLLFEDPTYSLLLRYAAEAVSRRGQTLVLLAAGTDDERANVLQYVNAGHVDGVMLISSSERDPFVGNLVRAHVPTVSSGIPLGAQDDLPSVAVDEDASARTMTRFLKERGYQRIAHIAGPQDTPGGRFRLAGFRAEMGDGLDEDLIAVGDYGRASGYEAMRGILSAGTAPDAVFAASDRMAAGAVDALRRAGLDVPGDVAVAGFDDSGLAATHDPPLTTMRQPWRQISDEMVDVLLTVIDGGEPRSVTLATTLEVRASTA
ncbi:LacI family DNA-binding transcriptional regulator [Microbacterium amylolyticum]|uniref:DNA-binding LacI/PurR family transcriptional regulator n=1 Tax=Microbacterium amylolyticum TaxID=936337 RepID=A0ABS4ZK54_9MICO|nr:LacI family DNA-binding transcriptional regulator [Microbacterium amylolyticum]MBP2437664.1 DNA-binding LacI/PurR family transcriptional regulator [Microbacterium amylolyticum]